MPPLKPLKAYQDEDTIDYTFPAGTSDADAFNVMSADRDAAGLPAYQASPPTLRSMPLSTRYGELPTGGDFFGRYLQQARERIEPLYAKRNALYENVYNTVRMAEESRKPLMSGIFAALGSLAGGGSIGQAASAASNYGFLTLKNLRDEEKVTREILGTELTDVQAQIVDAEARVNASVLAQEQMDAQIALAEAKGEFPGTQQFKDKQELSNMSRLINMGLGQRRDARAAKDQEIRVEENTFERDTSISNIAVGEFIPRNPIEWIGENSKGKRLKEIRDQDVAIKNLQNVIGEVVDTFVEYDQSVRTGSPQNEAAARAQSKLSTILGSTVGIIDKKMNIGAALSKNEALLKLMPFIVDLTENRMAMATAFNRFVEGGDGLSSFLGLIQERARSENLGAQIKGMQDALESERVFRLENEGLFRRPQTREEYEGLSSEEKAAFDMVEKATERARYYVEKDSMGGFEYQPRGSLREFSVSQLAEQPAESLSREQVQEIMDNFETLSPEEQQKYAEKLIGLVEKYNIR